MDKEQFIKQYISASGISRELFNDYFTAVECDCGGNECQGWLVLSHEELNHNMELDNYLTEH